MRNSTLMVFSDRTLPRCVVCVETSQACDYPSGPMKPGPKIGTAQVLTIGAVPHDNQTAVQALYIVEGNGQGTTV
jgi:hypothetical protein